MVHTIWPAAKCGPLNDEKPNPTMGGQFGPIAVGTLSPSLKESSHADSRTPRFHGEPIWGSSFIQLFSFALDFDELYNLCCSHKKVKDRVLKCSESQSYRFVGISSLDNT